MTKTKATKLHTTHNNQHQRPGLSLVEAIAVIAVLAVIGGSSAGLLIRASTAYAASRDAASIHRETSAALERIARELRDAAPIPTDDASEYRAPIHEATATMVRFGNDRRLTLSGTMLNWSENNGADDWPILTDVRSFTLTYYDPDGTPIASPLPANPIVHSVSINIEAGSPDRPVKLRTTTFLRANLARLHDTN